MFRYFSENLLKWKEYLKMLKNSEVGAKHQIASVFSFSQIMWFRQLMISLSDETMKSFLTQFFYLLFGCCTANFGPQLRGEPHLPNVNHSITYFDLIVTRSLVTRFGF